MIMTVTRHLCLLVVLVSVAATPWVARGRKPMAVQQLQLTEVGTAFDGGTVIFICDGTLVVQRLKPGFHDEERHAIRLDDAALRELDALALALLDAKEPANAQLVPMSANVYPVTLDLLMRSGRARTFFTPNNNYVWFSSVPAWVGGRAAAALALPPVRTGPYDPAWRPAGWVMPKAP
jgi:hypothetical protein